MLPVGRGGGGEMPIGRGRGILRLWDRGVKVLPKPINLASLYR